MSRRTGIYTPNRTRTPNEGHAMTHLLHRARANLAVLAAVAAFGLAAAPAQAAPFYLINATNNAMAPEPGFGNVAFSLTYEDINMDMLFSLNELLAFSDNGIIPGSTDHFDTLLGVPTTSETTGTGTGLDWLFHDSTGTLVDFSAPAARFTPFTTALTLGTVPEPAGLGLVLAGLAALRLSRRRRALLISASARLSR